jgi:hypothetical protein
MKRKVVKASTIYFSFACVMLATVVVGKVANEDKENRTPDNQAFIDRVKMNKDMSPKEVEKSNARTKKTELSQADLSYALECIFTNEDHELNKVYLYLMGIHCEEVFSHFKGKLDNDETLSDRENKSFLYWAKEVEQKDMFCFVMDHFIDNKNTMPAQEDRFGKPLRYSDVAYNVAYSQIEGVRQWSSKGTIFRPHKIDDRNMRIVLFKNWWSANKTNLAWSIEKEKFFVPAEKEIGDGIILDAKKNEVIPEKTSRITEIKKGIKSDKTAVK